MFSTFLSRFLRDGRGLAGCGSLKHRDKNYYLRYFLSRRKHLKSCIFFSPLIPQDEGAFGTSGNPSGSRQKSQLCREIFINGGKESSEPFPVPEGTPGDKGMEGQDTGNLSSGEH